jgi:hypothetical protein
MSTCGSRTSPERTSSTRTSRTRTSTARTSRARASTARTSPTRGSLARTRKDRTHPADFTDAILTGAHWPADAQAPVGWERYPADSDRLRLVGGEAPESPAS